MKKKLLLLGLMLMSAFNALAQEIKTYSSCDTNTDESVTITDVTNTANKVLGRVAIEQNMVTAEQLNASFNTILEKLASIEARLIALETSNSKMKEALGITVNGYECVDLGLSVKWATCNVGASSPEDNGYYFAWGETTGYTSDTSDGRSFDWSNLKYCSGTTDEGPFTKYVASSTYGTVDNLTSLESSDDAAHVNWGGNWRMPTDEEFTELRTSCAWTWTTQNGINGYKVTGTNGNSIFLPATGCRNNSLLDDAGSDGGYWSSSLNSSYSYYAYRVYFTSSNVYRQNGSRCYGRSVRAVCP